MKQFFKFFFASMLGFIVGGILLLFISIGIISAVVSSLSRQEKTTINPKSVLVLSLNYQIPEKTDENPFHNFNFSTFEPKVEPGLNDILKSIDKAKTDSSIKGIYLNTGLFLSGTATAEQIRNALIDFKTSKKFVVAYAEGYTQKGYYVATAADKIFLNPQGELEFKGLSAQIMFLKGLLDKLGVETQVFYDGKYKTATEPFRYDKMSEPNKEMTKDLLDNIEGHYIQGIATARHISPSKLDSIAGNLLIRDAKDAKAYGMVDDIISNDQVEQYIADQLKLEKKAKISFVTMGKYDETPEHKTGSYDAGKIAVLYLQGDIVDGEGEKDNIGSDMFLRELSKLRKDDKVKAIVLRVNSPGGSALASDVMWREVGITRDVKPVVVSMGDYAASGGYYISCQASKIVAEPNTLTGSIGVFGLLPNMQKFFNDKLGITFDGVGTGKYSDFGNLTRPMREDEKAIVQGEIDSMYHTFKSKVAEGRKLPLVFVDSIAQGRVWTGSQALKLGLVDTLGDVNVAIHIAAKLANLKDYRVAEYPAEENNYLKMLKAFNDNNDDKMIKGRLGEYYTVFKKMEELVNMKGVQARMPFEFDIE